MTLGFSENFPNGDFTFFQQKIWLGLTSLLGYDQSVHDRFYNKHIKKHGNNWPVCTAIEKPKIHTMRADQKGRWKPGRFIHMVTGNRTKNRFQFAPPISCKSVQEIEIIYTSSEYHKICAGVFIDGLMYGCAFGQTEITEWDNNIIRGG